MVKDIYIDRLGLYFEDNEQLSHYVEKHYDIFTKEELKNIIVDLAKECEENEQV